MTYRRSAKMGWLVLLFAVAYLGVMIYGAIPTDIQPVGLGDQTVRFQQVSAGRLVAVAIGVAVLALGAVIIVRRSRHPIVVEREGITDTAALPGRIPWTAVHDVALDGSEQTGYRLLLTVAGANGTAQVRVELEGVGDSPSAVFSQAFDAWRAATGPTRSPT